MKDPAWRKHRGDSRSERGYAALAGPRDGR